MNTDPKAVAEAGERAKALVHSPETYAAAIIRMVGDPILLFDLTEEGEATFIENHRKREREQPIQDEQRWTDAQLGQVFEALTEFVRDLRKKGRVERVKRFGHVTTRRRG